MGGWIDRRADREIDIAKSFPSPKGLYQFALSPAVYMNVSALLESFSELLQQNEFYFKIFAYLSREKCISEQFRVSVIMSQIEQISYGCQYINILISGLCIHISGLFFSIKFFICFVQFLRLGSWYIRKISTLSVINVANIFFCFCLNCSKFLNRYLKLAIFCCLWVLSHSSKRLPLTRMQRNLSTFSCLISFITFGLLFSLEFILVYVLRCGPNFIFIQMSSQLSQLTFYLLIDLFLFSAALGLCCCSQAFSSCGNRGLLCCSTWTQYLRLVGSGAWAQQLWGTGLVALGTWNLPGQDTEPVSPASAGRFLSTVPQGKSPVLLKSLSLIKCFEMQPFLDQKFCVYMDLFLVFLFYLLTYFFLHLSLSPLYVLMSDRN